MFSNSEFLINDAAAFHSLRTAFEKHFPNRQIDSQTEALLKRGLIDADGLITTEGLAALKPFAVDNAIIMAAGFSSRFAPVSYEIPKGLVTVRGEKLIERQIRQLQSAGIVDITVVTGYKAEAFAYIAEAFNVRLIHNPEYSVRNNHSSLHVVQARLGNTYICSSDNYFLENPFHRYEYSAFYSTQFSDGPTDEWCVSTDENNVITGTEIGGNHAWYMIGHAYFDRAFSEKFTAILNNGYNDPAIRPKLWESVYLENIGTLTMRREKVSPDNILEFDRIADAQLFDPQILNNTESTVLTHIENALGISRQELTDFVPLKNGLTNLSCRFSARGKTYIYRYPGAGTEQLVDRHAEFAALHAAATHGLDGTFLTGDENSGWKLSVYLPDAREPDPRNPGDLQGIMALMRKLHTTPVSLSRTFDFVTEGLKYQQHLTVAGVIRCADDKALDEKIAALHHALLPQPLCLTHNDFFGPNILIDKDNRFHLIDWEYAGMGRPSQDFGTFVVTSRLTPPEAEAALAVYLDHLPTQKDRAEHWSAVAFAGWCWYNWACVKESTGESVGTWTAVYRDYAEHYLRLAEKALT